MYINTFLTYPMAPVRSQFKGRKAAYNVAHNKFHASNNFNYKVTATMRRRSAYAHSLAQSNPIAPIKHQYLKW
jgi:hypothetical protein